MEDWNRQVRRDYALVSGVTAAILGGVLAAVVFGGWFDFSSTTATIAVLVTATVMGILGAYYGEGLWKHLACMLRDLFWSS